MSELAALLNQAEQDITAAKTLPDINDLRVKYLGKSGLITSKLKTLGALPVEERKTAGQEINKIKEAVAKLVNDKINQLEQAEITKKLATETLDITLPIRPTPKGSIHPITQVIDEVTSILGGLGFNFVDGPNLEDDFHNFTALNIPATHPARQMHDTFYVDVDGEEKVLRTHTSPVQIRTMKAGKPPFKIISAGRTYRSDSDITHTPMFHQVEGLYIDKNIHMGHLKYVLQQFIEQFFGIKDVPMRFRPSYFPFTEPSAEVDIGCSRNKGDLKIGAGNSWLEVLGCGMVNQNVLKNVGIDPDEYQGFAFGMGIERLAMLKYNIADLRTFFTADARWLEHYGFNSLNIPNLVSKI